MDYTNPPIIEAICEFRFTPDTEWDATVPGLIYTAVKDRFPKKEQRIIQNVEIPSPTRGEVKVQQSRRAVFLTEDKNTQIQIATHLLAINRLKPYTKWDDFKADIEQTLNNLTDNVDIKELQRIGLRYINQIEIPSPNIELEEYFEFRPELGQKLSTAPMMEFIIGYVQPYADGRDRCKTQLRSATPTKPDGVTFILDIDYFLAKPRTVAFDQALKWVNEAHQNIENIFENCIKDPLREVFRQVK